MAAPNRQPAGSRPGPKAPFEHEPHKSGKPASTHSQGYDMGKGSGGAPHGTPKAVGNGKGNPLR
jgi:hypothetical protein